MKNWIKSKLSSDTQYLLSLIINRKFNELHYYRDRLKDPVIDYTPPVISATIVNNCNLRCPTCLYLLENKDKFSSGYLSSGNMVSVLNRYKGAGAIFLTGGEPLLHPDIGRLIDICRGYGLKVKMSSNGILVKEKIDDIAKLDYVNVSLDAYDYESFKENRGGSMKQFDDIIEGLRLLKERNMSFSISFVLSLENVEKVSEILELVEKVRPRFVYFHNINPHGSEFKALTMQDEKVKDFLDEITAKTNYPFDIEISHIFDVESKEFMEAKCIQPWTYLGFDVDGNVSYCCHLAHDKNIGNVFNGYDYNSQKMVEFRKSIMDDVVPESCMFCQRRFMGKEFGRFDSKLRKWIVNG